MSLHSQLLRGLFALPLMLLLAIAGVVAPDAAVSLPPPAPAAMDQPLVFDPSLPDTCPDRVVRVQLARS